MQIQQDHYDIIDIYVNNIHTIDLLGVLDEGTASFCGLFSSVNITNKHTSPHSTIINTTSTRLTELRLYVPPDTKKVIMETFFPANHLA